MWPAVIYRYLGHSGESDRAWKRLAITLWLVAVGIIFLRVVLQPEVHSVYPIFARAARRWISGSGLYPPEAPDLYRYTPLMTALVVPFALLPAWLGELLWRIANVAVLILGLRVWLPRVPGLEEDGKVRAWVYLLILPMAIHNLNNGQTNPLVLGLLLISIWAIFLSRWNLAAIAVTLATAVKVYPLAAGFLFGVIFPGLFASLALWLAVGCAIPFVLQAPAYVLRQYQALFSYLPVEDRTLLPPPEWVADIRLLLRYIDVRPEPEAYALVEVAAGLLFALICWKALRAGWGKAELLFLAMGLGGCWMTLFGPATESKTFLLLTPVLACLLVGAGGQLAPGQMAARWLWMAYGLLMMVRVANWFPFGREFYALGLETLASVVLTAYLIMAAARRIWA